MNTSSTSSPPEETLYQVTAPKRGRFNGFTAGAIVREGIVIDAAPIIKWCIGQTEAWLEQHARLKRWTLTTAPMLSRRQES